MNSIKRIATISFCFLSLLLMSMMAFAATEVPDGDPLSTLLTLVTTFKGAAPLAIGVALVTITVQVLKKFVGDFKFKRLVVTALSLIYSFLLSMTTGLNWYQSAAAAVITGGGAVAMYEAIKGLTGNSSQAT